MDINDPINHGKPLWVVCGRNGDSSIYCVKLLAYDSNYVLLPIGHRGDHVCIWGYSVYKGKPGFRTLGIKVEEWADRFSKAPIFYDSLEEAIKKVTKLLTPKDM
jgi:hypothetical protein